MKVYQFLMIIQSGFNNINTYNLNLRKQTDLEFYWKQMVENLEEKT